MPRLPPALRQHHTGVWFVRFGGKDHVLYKDYQKSLEEYPKLLAEWMAKQAQKPAPVKGGFKLVDLHGLWMAAMERDYSPRQAAFCRLYTKRFLHAFGDLVEGEFTVSSLDDLKTALMQEGLAPKTIKHNLDTSKSMLRWGADMEKWRAMNLRRVKAPPQKAPTPEPLAPAVLKATIKKAETADERLGPWMRLQYLAFMRVSEVQRLVQREGEWVETGVFKLAKSKMEKKTGVPRHIVLTPTALKQLEQAVPAWRGASGYYKAAVGACGLGGPHVLRDSAATHALEKGATKEEVEWLLGHISGGAWQSYGRLPWQRLRKVAARLRL